MVNAIRKDETMERAKYYTIRKCYLRIGIILIVFLWGLSLFILKGNIGKTSEQEKETSGEEIKYRQLESQLSNQGECYLCGLSDKSVMSMFQGFNTIGIIDLHEWNIIDFRLKEYDENGNEIIDSPGSDMVTGNTNNVQYSVYCVPSRGRAEATFTYKDGKINSSNLVEHLCQGCLDKVTSTLTTYASDEKQAEYVPLCVVDFETLEIYSLQEKNLSYYVRDYWLELERNEHTLSLQVYYLPEHN